MAETINVGVLRALLTLDSATFESGMREASGSAKKFASDMGKLGSNLSGLGTRLTASVTLPIVGAFGAASKAAIDFESSFAGVRKTVEASEADFKVMEQQFRGLAKTIPVSVNELNKLGEAAGALGIPKEEIVDFARVMAELGVTTNLTSDQAADAIARIQNIFGAAGQDTERLASTIVALGNAGASTEAEITEMAQRIAGAGHTVGLTQAQVVGFASTLASVGINAEAGGSAISRVFLKMNDAVAKGGDSLQSFADVAGVSAAAFKEAFEKDASQATVAFIEGLARMKAEGQNINAVIEGVTGKNIILKDTLLRLVGAGGELSRQLGVANTAWQENTALATEAGTRFGTTESQLTLLWNKLSDVGITLGKVLVPMISALIDVLNTLMPALEFMVNTFAAMPVAIQGVVVVFGLLLAAIGPVLMIVGQMALGVSALAGVGGFSGLAASIAGFLPSWGAIVTAGAAVVTFFTTTLPAAFAAAIAFLGPQGLIALAIIGLGLIWYKWGDDIKAFLKPLTDWIVAQFVWLKDQIVAAWKAVVDTTTTFFSNLAGILKKIPTDLLLPLLGPIGAVVLAFKKWPEIVQVAQQVYQGIKTWMVDKFTGIVDSVKAKIQAVSDAFRDMAKAVVLNSYVPDMISGIEDEFGRLDGVMVSPAQGATSMVQSTFRDMQSEVVGIVDDMLRSVSSALSGWLDDFMPSWAARLLGGIAETGLQALGNMVGLGSVLGGGGISIPGIGGLLGGGAAGAGAAGAGAAGAGAAGAGAGAAGAGGGGAAAGVGGGIGLGATVGLTAGIGGAALLAWAIWKKGLFRGGEEALKVNPARDEYFQQFQQQFGGSQFEAMAKAFAESGVSGDIAQRLIKDLYDADSMKEFEAATAAIRDALSGAAKSASATADGIANTTTALAAFNTSIDRLETMGTVSEEAINALRAQIADLSATTNPDIIAQLNATLEQMIASGSVSDEMVQKLVSTIAQMSQQTQDTTTQTDDLTGASSDLEDQFDRNCWMTLEMRNRLAELEQISGSAEEAWRRLSEEMAQPIDIEINVPTINLGDYMNGPTGEIPSFANEGIVRSPMLAMVGDAKEPEWILHQSSVMDMARRAFSLGAFAGNQADGLDGSVPRSSSAGRDGGVQIGSLSVTVNSASGNAQTLARELLAAIPQAMRMDHNLVRQIRGAVA